MIITFQKWMQEIKNLYENEEPDGRFRYAMIPSDLVFLSSLKKEGENWPLVEFRDRIERPSVEWQYLAFRRPVLKIGWDPDNDDARSHILLDYGTLDFKFEDKKLILSASQDGIQTVLSVKEMRYLPPLKFNV